ncbi:MAG: TetR/AcrR family transcriptional regulator [Deltaproteobacteria bacterium]|nr:TetR/AcrR family transcriptional regulator [Deltaproteobacteria bacterium]
MGKKRITKGERYSQIIDCATKVFAKKGYSGATTKNISEAAGISEKNNLCSFISKTSKTCF